MRERLLLTGWIHLVAMCLLAGCSTAPVQAPADPVLKANYPEIELDPALQGWIVVGEPVVEKGTSGNIERVSVPIRAATESTEMNVQYEYTYFDAKDMKLRINTGFRFKTLAARRQEFFEDTPMDNTAVRFRLYIRPAR